VTGRVALVTAGEYAHHDDDLPPIVDALTAHDVDAVVADWHDARARWAEVDLAVIRSTWDYTWHLDEFLAWVDRVSAATRLANPAAVVRWNIDKRYLLDLAAAGVPTVPTRIVEPGDDLDGPVLREALSTAAEIVVKPVVSAGARDTERHAPEQGARARAHVERLLGEGRATMVQPYLSEIDEHGETGLVFLGDVLSHAFRKGPLLVPGTELVDGLYRAETITPADASPAERKLAQAALDAVADHLPGLSRRDLLYARIDIARHDGGHVLLELELVEPSLFCSTSAGAADRAAAAIAAALAA
jgi:glutathione synthase/RimK-type ligase-like ATP-grasp enzyme